MNEYYQLEPEVSGEIGEKSIMDTSVHPPKIEKLEFIFKGWLGDCLVESFPVYLVSTKALNKLKEKKISGFAIKKVEVKKDYPFDQIHPNTQLPNFEWIEINGIKGENDICLVDNMISVRKEVLEILKSEGLNHCDIEKI